MIGFFIGPEGATINFMERYARRFEEIFAKLPEAQAVFAVSGNPIVSQGISQGEALAALEEAARRVLPPAVQIDYIGQSREYKQASGDIYFSSRASSTPSSSC